MNRIMLLFGTRPELIKLAPLIRELRNSPVSDRLTVINTAQHKELLSDQLSYWQIEPDYSLDLQLRNGNLTHLLSESLSSLQDIFDHIGLVEYIIVQGDTNTALAASLLAFFNRKKLIHIEAGLRTNNLGQPFPEEFNRLVASKVAYFHFAPTDLARQNLLAEGVDPSSIMLTGNTGIDALLVSLEKENALVSSQQRKIILVTLHRRENLSLNYRRLVDILKEIHQQHPDHSIIWIKHPNSSKTLQNYLSNYPEIKLVSHMPHNEFIRYYAHASMIFTDSGGVTEEATHLGLPVVVYREHTERKEAMLSGHPIIVSLEKRSVVDFVNKHISKPVEPQSYYGHGNASNKIFQWINEEIRPPHYETVVIGGGPAGTGLLMKAAKDGVLEHLLQSGIAVVEQDEILVCGDLPNYRVNSDTASNVFLECLEGKASRHFDKEDLQQEIKYIRQFHNRSIPLSKLEPYLSKLGLQLERIISASSTSKVYKKSKVIRIIKRDDASFEIILHPNKKRIIARNIVLATGGQPYIPEFLTFDKYRMIHSDHFIKGQWGGKIKKDSKIVILGGNHSAFSAAHYLLQHYSGSITNESPIKIWSHETPKVYYPSKSDAISGGYTDFNDQDLCPKTGRLYRLAGLRMDGRELYMRMLGLNDQPLEKRVELHLISKDPESYQKDLEEADLIILATGYSFNMPEFLNDGGESIRLEGDHTKHWVNAQCQLLDSEGKAIRNAYLVGLASGFIPSGELGGEPSFSGQTNGLWYYQNATAETILNQLLHALPANLS